MHAMISRRALAACLALAVSGVAASGCAGTAGPALQLYHDFRRAVLAEDWNAACECITVKGLSQLALIGEAAGALQSGEDPVVVGLKQQLGKSPGSEGLGPFAGCFDIQNASEAEIAVRVHLVREQGSGSFKITPARREGSASVETVVTVPIVEQVRASTDYAGRLTPSDPVTFAKYQPRIFHNEATSTLYLARALTDDELAELSASCDGPWGEVNDKARRQAARWLIAW